MTTHFIRPNVTTRQRAIILTLIISAIITLSTAARAQTATNFTTAGNSTWTCPNNVYTLQVEAYGAGGGGGGTLNSSGVAAYGEAGGGAGGSYVKYNVNVTPGTVYNLTVGAGGTGGTNTVSATWSGITGGSSYFGNTSAGTTNGALVLAVGGPGGVGNYNQLGISSARIGNLAGGVATTNGNIPLVSAQAGFKDYAGTSGGISVGGAQGTAASGAGGAGAGASGSSGGGAGGAAVISSGSSTPGNNGTAPGGGGSGASNLTLSKKGGDGGAGRVVLTYLVNTNVAGSSTVVASPTTVPADGTTTSTVTVTLQDAGSNALSGKTITLASSRGATDTISPASATTSSSGIATFTVKSSTGGSAILTATDSTDSITVTQTATVSFLAASIDHFTVTPSAGSAIAGQGFTVTVQAYATAGSGSPINNNSADGVTVAMTSSGAAQFDANGDGTYGDNTKPLTNGTFTINVTDLKAENITLTATAGTATGTSSSVSITPGAVAQLQLLLPGETAAPGTTTGKTGTPTPRTAGGGFNVTVNAVDTNWNVTASGDTVSLTASNDAGAVLPANTALSGGTVMLALTNIVAGGGKSLTASDVSNGSIVSNTSPAYVVVPGAVARMLLLAPGESATFGTSPGKSGSPSAQNSTIGYSVTVDALDAYYNLVTNDTDIAGISSSAAGDTLPANAALAGGTATFSLTNNTVGSATLTATNVTQGTAVATGTSTVPVSINSTTTVLTSSANPVNAGASITFTATVGGAGLKTGTVTFKNGTATLATKALSGNGATFTTSGGAGTYSITATYNGDANNSTSTSGALSQVIQTSGATVHAEMEDGFDYNLISSMPVTNQIPGVSNWMSTSDFSSNTATSSHNLIIAGDLSGATTPDIKPLPNQTTNVAAHLEMSKGASDREFLRSIGSSIGTGSAYFSFLLDTTVVPTVTTNEVMMTMLASNVNNYPVGNDPLTLYARTNSGAANSYNLGLARLGGSIVWATASLVKNTNYLLVVKYTFGGTDSLYINPTPGTGEPVTPDAVATSGAVAEPANIGTILFYEANTSGAPLTTGTYNYDVMRVDNNWANVTPASNGFFVGAAGLSITPGPQVLSVSSNSALMTVTLLDQNNNTFTATSNTVISLSSTSGGGTFLSGADGTTVITSVVISNGTSTATFYYKDSSVGSPTITATSGLLSPATQTETVGMIRVTSSKNPSGFKDSVQFTAGVPSGATGSVTFLTNSAVFDIETISAGSATSVATTLLPRGTNLITVQYAGDSNFAGLTNTLNQVVTNHPPVAQTMTVSRTAGLNLLVSLANVATNWSDADGDNVALNRISLVSTNGVNLQTNSSYILYTNNLNVADQIGYGISDGQGGTNIGYINIVINASVTGTNSITKIVSSNPTTLTAYGIPSYNYIAERSTNLTTWVDISTNTAAANGVISVTDNFNDLGGIQPVAAYYRLKWQP